MPHGDVFEPGDRVRIYLNDVAGCPFLYGTGTIDYPSVHITVDPNWVPVLMDVTLVRQVWPVELVHHMTLLDKLTEAG